MLRRAAEKRGTDTDALVREAVLQMLTQTQHAAAEDLPAPAESLADAFAGRIGRIDGTSEALSEQTGRRFTEYVVEKHRQGRL
jgi:hypothetical protein